MGQVVGSGAERSQRCAWACLFLAWLFVPGVSGEREDSHRGKEDEGLMARWTPPMCPDGGARYSVSPGYTSRHWYAGLGNTTLANNHSCRLAVPEGPLLVPCLDPATVRPDCPRGRRFSSMDRHGVLTIQCPGQATYAAFDDALGEPSPPAFVPYAGPVAVNASRVIARCAAGGRPEHNYHARVALAPPAGGGHCGNVSGGPAAKAGRLILVVLVDSIGRASFMRSFPRVLGYLEELQRRQYHVYEFFRFAVSGRDTSHNIPQMFAGMQVPRKRPRWGARSPACPSCIYLPNLLRQWNYTSCYASDLRFNSAYFGLAGQYVFNGTGALSGGPFPSPQTSLGAHHDHYLDFGRTFVQWKGEECGKALNEEGHVYCPFAEESLGHCWGGRRAVDYVLDFATDCVTQRLECKRYVYVHVQVAHNVRMATVRGLDAPLVQLLRHVVEQEGVFVLTSDHGLTYSPYATAEHGRLEWKNGPLLLGLPRGAVGWDVDATLRHNAQQFVSKWDFYKTMARLPANLFRDPAYESGLDRVLRRKPPKFDLLTQRVPPNRTCAQAGVPHYFCLCAKWQAIVKPAELLAYRALLPLVAQFLHRMAPAPLCVAWSAADLDLLAVRYTAEDAHILEADVRVRPAALPQQNAGPVAWSVVFKLPSLQRMAQGEVINAVRTAKYGHLWQCVSAEAQKYCVCKGPK